MTEDPLGRDDASVDSSEFLDWLDQMAEAEGVSREELIESLVSSYWTLDEMLSLMEQADPDADLPDAGPTGHRHGPRWKRLADVEQDLAGRIDDLDDRLASLRSDLEGGRDAALADDHHQELEARLDELASRLDAMDAESADDLGRASAVAEIADEVETLEASLSSRQDALEARIETEFGHLRTILEHLISTTDDLEDRTARLESTTDEEVREFLASVDRLADLKRTAAQLGVRTATCGYCEKKIDVALLPAPECPQCERRFVDIEPKRGWFGSATLVVADEARSGRSVPSPPTIDDDDTDVGSPSDRTDDGTDGFDWIGDD